MQETELMIVASISIHAPREGSDPVLLMLSTPLQQFQSTLPVKGATMIGNYAVRKTGYFNPRSP